jgi:regulator of protease activity HflC (stomatin/prohibitin superfamily)
MMELVLALIAVAGIVILFGHYGLRRITIFEYQGGLKYSSGKFVEVLKAGQYWYLPFFTAISVVDIRSRSITIPGQEVLTADNVSLKVSLAVSFEVIDLEKAVNKVQDYQAALYLELQVALRSVIGSATADDLLERKDNLGSKVKEMTEPKSNELGLLLHSVHIKDIMFPGQLKNVFAQVVTAKKEGLAALEKARGEAAALRSLANAAQMVERNPGLLELRALQNSTANTVVIGIPQVGGVPVPSAKKGGQGSDSAPQGS